MGTVAEKLNNGWWKSVLLAAGMTVIIGTGSYLWRGHDTNVIGLEIEVEKLDKKKVDKSIYEVQLNRVERDIQEIKEDIKAQRRTLEEIRIMIARDNGGR